uniref:Nuclear autoantigenic sperm protein n=1 Tax=Anthurium amnicola TaxID=1678845 RepID=A0A1D1XQH1_9ARAE
MVDPDEAAPAETLVGDGIADEHPAAPPQENPGVENDGSSTTADSSVAAEPEETLAPDGGGKGLVLQESGGSSVLGGAGGSSPSGGEAEGSDGPEDKLARADELFQKGSSAIEDGDFVEAVDCLSRALEIRVAHYGELASECASSYYKYGCALLYKAQEEADPLGNVPKGSSRNSEIATTAESGVNGASSKTSVSDDKPNNSLGSNEEEREPGSCKEDQEDDNEGSDDDEDLGEGDEDDSDLDLAWKMLDIARAIVEKQPEDSIVKVNILAALGEVAVEREDIETSLGDYHKALSILENLVEPNHRRIIELNFRICLVLELGSKVEEAIPYCKKALSLCESRLLQLKECLADKKDSMLATGDAGSLSTTNEIAGQSSSVSHPLAMSEKEQEIEVIGGIFYELEKKLEDLQQLMLNPTSVFAEIMKMASSKSPILETNTSLSSSQMGVVNGASDSSAISTAATDCSVKHLGVVGRGVKRASIAPIVAESSPKRLLFDTFSDKADSNVSEVLDSKAAESPPTQQ